MPGSRRHGWQIGSRVRTLTGRVIKVPLLVLALLIGLYMWNRRLSRLNRKLDAARRQLAAQVLELAKHATTDRLTGLSNRRKLDETLAQELARCQRHRRPLALLLLDLHHFKRVNDAFGHLVGDPVLSELSSLLRAQCRETDTPGRWGGEEFLIICPEIPAETAATLAERLRAYVSRRVFTDVGKISISVGVTDQRPEDDADSMLARVDAAPKEAKRSGRNRIVVS
jgi:diguanylate cyclase (GGDEF)-like protein